MTTLDRESRTHFHRTVAQGTTATETTSARTALRCLGAGRSGVVANVVAGPPEAGYPVRGHASRHAGLRGYLVIGAILLVVKAIQLGSACLNPFAPPG
jgi:hypothetical protein